MINSKSLLSVRFVSFELWVNWSLFRWAKKATKWSLIKIKIKITRSFSVDSWTECFQEKNFQQKMNENNQRTIRVVFCHCILFVFYSPSRYASMIHSSFVSCFFFKFLFYSAYDTLESKSSFTSGYWMKMEIRFFFSFCKFWVFLFMIDLCVCVFVYVCMAGHTTYEKLAIAVAARDTLKSDCCIRFCAIERGAAYVSIYMYKLCFAIYVLFSRWLWTLVWTDTVNARASACE